MKQKIFIILLSLPLLFAGYQSYKQVPYLQGNMQQAARSDTTAPNPTLYDARIMPKNLPTIVASYPEAPELAEPFNLTVSSPISNTSNEYLTSQPVLQQYLVDNRGNIDFPVLGTIHLGGLTKGEAEQLVGEKLKSQFHEMPIVTVRVVSYKISVIDEVSRPGTFTVSNEKVNLFEVLAMAEDMTIYGIRNNVKLIHEDNRGQQEVITLNLNDQDILHSPYYHLQQNDILYIAPNKTKTKISNISSSTTIWFSVIDSLVSLASLIIAITKQRTN